MTGHFGDKIYEGLTCKISGHRSFVEEEIMFLIFVIFPHGKLIEKLFDLQRP